ncbi:SDR family oxidoreductase [Thalassospira sp. MCCC 1A01428]|uniref:SDR family oxidoreductase n=1 Tax=Thalassospira sp. MCCC 1A01428 TaxID=1470575 RepID=UPI000A1F73EE|nr:SDR family oxidoreductase [Thalassospira sp. MCCC 1A01428]OSQ43113.1 2-deoxy-D-gluconate 3-dehydrogenase [Thalassospira sp. MCCC 1A01428]
MSKTEMVSFDLSGKTALVTGCNRGIGAAIAVGLAHAGADIIGVSSNLEPDGGKTGDLVRQAGRKFDAYQCDLGVRKSIHAFVKTVAETKRPVDILVNNAGIIRRNPAIAHSDQDWDDVMAVNLDAPFILSRDFGREMVRRGAGKIIFVASVLSFQGGINVPGYAASKGAITQMVRSLANEWAAYGVNVNAIAPGYIETDNTRALREDEQRTRELMARVPAQRWGAADDLAGPVVFLASDAARFVHGAILPVDGGWLAR